MGFSFGSKDERLKERITIRLDKEIYDKLKENGPVSNTVRDALNAYLDENERNNKKN